MIAWQVRDLINATFEIGGALVLWLNVRRVWIDRKVAGTSVAPVIWFTLWGFWNIHFYSALGQYLSAFAGFWVCLVNVIWLVLVFKFRGEAPKEGPPK